MPPLPGHVGQKWVCITSASPIDFPTETLPSWLCVLYTCEVPSAQFISILISVCVSVCSIQAQKQTKTKKKKKNQVNSIQFNSFGGIHPTSTDPVSPYSCSTTFPILTDVPPDPQSHLPIYYLVLQLFLRVGILLLSPGPNQAPDLTKPSCRPWRWRPDDRRGPITIGSIGQFIGDVQGPRTVMHFVVVPSDRIGDELLYAASP